MTTSTLLDRCKQLMLFSFALAAASCTVDATGAVEDTNSVQQAATNGDVGFAWVSGSSIVAGRSYNNKGGTNSVVSLGSNLYRVDFPGLGGTGGNLQVTATGTPANSHGGTNSWCKVERFSSAGTLLMVFVKCWASSVFTTSSFTVAFQRRSGVVTSAETAYVYADRPSVGSYAPSDQWSSGGGTATISRESPGVYKVFFPGQAASGHRVVETTAVGTDGSYCTPSPGDTNTDARVRCYSSAASPLDSKFMAVFSRKSPNNVGSYMFATVQDNTVLDSYGAVASQCVADTPITSPATAGPGSFGSTTRVHFPQLSVTGLQYSVSAMAYGIATARCQIVSAGAETSGGTYAEVFCFGGSGTIPFVVVFSTTQAIFC